jgi:predicted ArsR family transcriptional regulator
LFALLQSLKREASTQELAEKLGLHVNGVRRHLDRLREEGLIERVRARGERGRPRDRWSIDAQAQPRGERPRAYGDLARWLARAIVTGPARLRETERAGREIGRELAPAAQRSARGFERVLVALGFQPDLKIEANGAVHCRLCNCPYRDSVRENPELICTLHKGITVGLLDQLAPEARLTAFEPRDPDRAGCVVEIAGTDWGAEGTEPR